MCTHFYWIIIDGLKIDKKVKKMSLEKKILWFFEHVRKELNKDDLELLKIGFFDNDGNVVFRKSVVKWRDFNEFMDKKQQ